MIRKNNVAIKKERARIFSQIKKMSNMELGGNSVTSIFLLRHKKLDLFTELWKRDIITADFRNALGLENNGFVRITIETKNENNILLEALEQIN